MAENIRVILQYIWIILIISVPILDVILVRKRHIKSIIVYNISLVIVSTFTMRVYCELPKYGFMPGLTYIGNYILCWVLNTVCIASLISVITIICIERIVQRKGRQDNGNKRTNNSK